MLTMVDSVECLEDVRVEPDNNLDAVRPMNARCDGGAALPSTEQSRAYGMGVLRTIVFWSLSLPRTTEGSLRHLLPEYK